jgi:hypothetical protein
LQQVKKAIDIFERIHGPGVQALFMFDNATTHHKRAPNAISAKKMPKSRKKWHPDQPCMHNGTLPDGKPQDFYWSNGDFKGMGQILKERGLWTNGLKADCKQSSKNNECCCHHILFNQPDFVKQKSALEELIESRGHLCDFYPKFHCELNFIEQYWGAAKFRYHATPPTPHIDAMEANVKSCLDAIPLIQICR